MPSLTLKAVHQLKGAPLSIVVALLLLQRSAKAIELARYCNYDQDTITKALRKLEDVFLFGLVVRVRGGWCLADSAYQLPLTGEPNGENPKFSDNPPSSSRVNIVNESKELTTTNQNPKFSDNYEVCKELGIVEPSASVISDLEHVTPEYIRAHVYNLKESDTLGAAVYRIKKGWKMPVTVFVKEININECFLDDDASTSDKLVASIKYGQYLKQQEKRKGSK